MHHCFSIPEIVSIICENISDLPDIGGLSCELVDLAAFARTCRAVHEQALDRLWHTQTSIIPLLRCMPDDVWENYREDEDDVDVDSKPRFIVVKYFTNRILSYLFLTCLRSVPSQSYSSF